MRKNEHQEDAQRQARSLSCLHRRDGRHYYPLPWRRPDSSRSGSGWKALLGRLSGGGLCDLSAPGAEHDLRLAQHVGKRGQMQPADRHIQMGHAQAAPTVTFSVQARPLLKGPDPR